MEHKCPTSRSGECSTSANSLFSLAIQAGVAPRRGEHEVSKNNDLRKSGKANPPAVSVAFRARVSHYVE